MGCLKCPWCSCEQFFKGAAIVSAVLVLLIHPILILTLPFVYVISVDDGLAWDAHIIYGSFHFVIFLLQVGIISNGSDIAKDFLDERAPEIWSENNCCIKFGLALVVGINSQILLLDNYTDMMFISMMAT